jgi:tetratricopeptide (TPR) repeat protein
LTEPRVIAEYLHLLVVPRSVSTGLFNDDFQVSTGLLQPASTLAAAILIIALSAFAIRFRKRWPALSAAIGFYLVGQLLESTTLPLELYFEHRNYLPAMLLFWPLGRAIAAWRRPAWIRVAVTSAILLVLASTTWSRARIWGQPDQLAALWAIKNPESSRAQAALAIEEHSRGGAQAAAERLAMELAKKPDDLQLAFNLVDARCGVAGIGDEDRAAVTRALQSSPTTALMMFQWLSQAVDVAASNGCKGLTLDVVQAWIDAAMRNPVNADPSSYGQDIQPLLARLALARQQPDIALAHFDLALRARVRPAVAARQAAELASSGYYEQALAHLDTYERLAPSAERPGRDMSRVHEWVLERQHFWPREIATLRTKLHAAIRDRR